MWVVGGPQQCHHYGRVRQPLKQIRWKLGINPFSMLKGSNDDVMNRAYLGRMSEGTRQVHRHFSFSLGSVIFRQICVTQTP